MCATFSTVFIIVLYYTSDYLESCTSKQSRSSLQLIEYFHKHLGGYETQRNGLLSAQLCVCVCICMCMHWGRADDLSRIQCLYRFAGAHRNQLN